jgi:FkbM family methyltransferase
MLEKRNQLLFMKELLAKKINNRFRRIFFNSGQISYSQAGEDMILNCIFILKNKGTYVDVGANHPTLSSNTYFFYKKGWSGLNIDALPYAINMFNKKRKRDINIQIGINDTEGILNFYTFKESSYNTFNEELVIEIQKLTPLISVNKIEVKPLSFILNLHKIKNIDFLTIDVEGLDINVLKSNDWNAYRPKVIVVEDFNCGLDIKLSKIYEYITKLGYLYLCRTITNAFYIEENFYNERFR